MKKKSIVLNILMIALTLYLIGTIIAPENMSRIVGFRFFTIMTDSMTPVFSPGALIVTSSLEDHDDIGDIITFHSDLLGDDIITTHRIVRTEHTEKGIRYITKGDNAEEEDSYETYAEDVLGTYLFHIPFAGKLIEYIKSPIGLAQIAIIFLLLLNQNILGEYFDNQDRLILKIACNKKLSIRKVDLRRSGESFSLTGNIYNPSKELVEPCQFLLELLDKDENVLEQKCFRLPKLQAKGKTSWEYSSELGQNIQNWRITLSPISGETGGTDVAEENHIES